MKKLLLFLPIGILTILMVAVVVVSTAFGQESGPVAHTADSFVNNFCFDGKVPEMDVDDLTEAYTDKTNQFFNTNIAYIMTNPGVEIPSIDLNDYDSNGGGLCKDPNGATPNDSACKSLALCKDNASAYCVGITALGFSPQRYQNYDDTVLQNFQQLRYSYFCYKASLESKRDSITDGSPASILAKCDNGSEFANEDICKLKTQLDQEKDPTKKANIQIEMDGMLSRGPAWSAASALSSITGTIIDLSDKSVQRVQFIDNEIKHSKQVLDQTLDAYSQIRTAWTMHVKYMDTYSDLVKYRDYLVSIRHETDTFPFKFIDATTTKCL